jgi:hypothetical protein
METRHPFVDWKTLVYGRCQSSVFFQFCRDKKLVKFSRILSNLVEFTPGKKKIGQKQEKLRPHLKPINFNTRFFFFNFVMLKKKLNLPMKPQNKSYLH